MVEKKKEILAIIPARSGSKSIPGKNIKLLGEHPLIAYSIAAGLQSEHVSRVIVSTDDREIADTANSYGAETPFMRPDELAEDHVTDLPVFIHTLEWLKKNEDYVPDIVVQLRPTSPFRPKQCVDEAIETLLSDSYADSVRGITCSGQNPFKMWQLNGSYMKPLMQSEFEEPYNMPRQELPSTYWQTGHIEVIRSATLLEQNSMTGKSILPYIIEPGYAIDLDTLVQWQYADYLMKKGRLNVVTPDFAGPSQLEDIGLVVFDFDGVFTDDHVYVDEFGFEMVRCHRGDGMGIAFLKDADIPCVVLSSEHNPVVSARCRKLEIPCLYGIKDKARALKKISGDYQIPMEKIAYIGNDLNDLGPMKLAGLSVAVRDAHPDIHQSAGWRLLQKGGSGAVREFCESLIELKREKERTNATAS